MKKNDFIVTVHQTASVFIPLFNEDFKCSRYNSSPMLLRLFDM